MYYMSIIVNIFVRIIINITATATIIIIIIIGNCYFISFNYFFNCLNCSNHLTIK